MKLAQTPKNKSTLNDSSKNSSISIPLPDSHSKFGHWDVFLQNTLPPYDCCIAVIVVSW